MVLPKKIYSNLLVDWALVDLVIDLFLSILSSLDLLGSIPHNHPPGVHNCFWNLVVFRFFADFTGFWRYKILPITCPLDTDFILFFFLHTKWNQATIQKEASGIWEYARHQNNCQEAVARTSDIIDF